MGERDGRLEIEEDPSFQRREWTVERVGWLVMAALVVGALLGLFGHGLLGYREASAPGLTVRYERVARNGGNTGLEVVVGPGQGEEGTVEVRVSQDYLAHVQVEHISPEPATTAVDDASLAFSFEVPDPATTLTVRFALRPDAIGPIEGRVALAGGPPASFDQFMVP